MIFTTNQEETIIYNFCYSLLPYLQKDFLELGSSFFSGSTGSLVAPKHNCCVGKQSMPKKFKQHLFYQVFTFTSQILIYFCEQSEPIFFKKVLNYQLSNASSKMSNSTCFTKLNPNIFLCRQAKQFQIVVVLVSQIFFKGKQSEPKNVKQYLFYQAKS